MNNIILDVKDLVSGYDPFFLKEINFKVKKGEFIGIIGPNGSGKTTLLRAITKVLKPKEGEILYGGENIWQMKSQNLAKKVAVVAQNPGISFMTVEDFVLLGRIPHYKKFQFMETKRDLDIAKRCMALTDTFRIRDQYVGEISGGERQLALIARALCQEPELFLLDEPTTHLDIAHQLGILDLIKKLNKDLGLTVITVLHDLNLASEYCHRLLLMHEGRVNKMGSPEEVLTYQVIEEVYKTVVVVNTSPVSSKPYIFIVTEEERQRRAKIKKNIES